LAERVAFPTSKREGRVALREALLELELADLRVHARDLAAGYQLGMHLSSKKGPGMEFLGHRAYTPGDDLRHLDRRSLLRHRRYLLREFQVETERPIHLLVDASASMNFMDAASSDARAARVIRSKSGYVRLLAAALALLAARAGDPVGLSLINSEKRQGALPDFLPPRGGTEQLERILVQLESAPNDVAVERTHAREVLLETVSRVPARATVLWLGDFLDETSEYEPYFAALGSKGRTLIAVQVLTNTEKTFPFRGPVVLVDPETGQRLETDAQKARDEYLLGLEKHNRALTETLLGLGGQLVDLTTNSDPRELFDRLNQQRRGRSA
jgi:uncharacterized protein (DUF58 family)